MMGAKIASEQVKSYIVTLQGEVAIKPGGFKENCSKWHFSGANLEKKAQIATKVNSWRPV